MKHVVVFKDSRFFSAWPHNGGMWQFANGEIAVGFVRGECDYGDPATLRHSLVDCQHGEHVVIRSSDGGVTWPLDSLTTVYRRPAIDECLKQMVPDYTRPSAVSYDPFGDGYCLLSGFGIPNKEQSNLAWTMVSQDRGQSWSAPSLLPSKWPYLQGRPNYLVRPDGLVLLFSFASTLKEQEGFPVVFASDDGGVSWGILSQISLTGPSIMGIMAHPVLLGDGTILVSIRRQYDSRNAYTEIYASTDGGLTWAFRSRVNEWGSPATLSCLPDGRVACVYGYRRPNRPGIRARLSSDAGFTWSKDIVLRDDGGGYDIGYPRTVVRPDGALVTVYYFHDKQRPDQSRASVRYIAATIWNP